MVSISYRSLYPVVLIENLLIRPVAINTDRKWSLKLFLLVGLLKVQLRLSDWYVVKHSPLTAAIQVRYPESHVR